MYVICRNYGKIVLIFLVWVAVTALINNSTYLGALLHRVRRHVNSLRNVVPYLRQGVLLQTVGCHRIKLNLSYPQISLVVSLGNGRLANQLSNFASCYALWREYGMYHHLNTMQLGLLEKTFVLPKLNADADNASYYLWNTGKFIEIHP